MVTYTMTEEASAHLGSDGGWCIVVGGNDNPCDGSSSACRGRSSGHPNCSNDAATTTRTITNSCSSDAPTTV